MKLTNRISQQEKVFFTKHLSVMLASGVPITESLSTLSEQTKSGYFKKVLRSVTSSVENGQNLAKALEKYNKVFGEFYVSMVEIGEKSGKLEENMNFLAKQMAKDYALRKKVQAAMLYPSIIMVATLIMGGFISYYVLPKLVGFFEDLDVELPLATRVLIFFANFVTNYGILVFAGLAATAILFTLFIRNKKTRPIWHKLLLKIPFLGGFITYVTLARMTRNFGTLLASGVAVSESLMITSNTLNNEVYRRELVRVKEALEKGGNIAESIEKRGGRLFPSVAVKMIAVGEKTGKLSETLIYLSEFFEEEIDNLSKNLATIIEPILLIAIGITVGFVAIAIISPIYQLTGSIRR